MPEKPAGGAEIAAWLAHLGLQQYTELFIEQALDLAVLPELTDQDLASVGIPLGHRKKLLRAITALPMPGSGPDLRHGELDVDRGELAERRQLTVLMCDIVDSTSLASRLDPEDMSRVLNACLNACTEAIARFQGHVARLLGDGLMAYFGYPFALEDAAERAVRAGLRAAKAVGSLDLVPERRLAIRTGIATGLVVVGELMGSGAAREEAVVGDTPAKANRLQALTRPGTVAIGSITRRLLGEAFELEFLGSYRLKGIEGETPAWAVIGERATESRFQAAHGAQMPSFVGREDELAVMLAAWEDAKDGRGRVVLVSGEAGIGKSRLCLQLQERLVGLPHQIMRLQCSPFHTGSALHPSIAYLERSAGLAPTQPAVEQYQRLRNWVTKTGGSENSLPLLGALLSLPPYEGGSPPDGSAKETKQRTLDVLIEWLAASAQQKPVLFVLEDAHWIDPSSRELATLCIERLAASPVLQVITFRPEFAHDWGRYSHVTQLELQRLGASSATQLVAHVTGGKPLPQEVLGHIVAKADGIPLFVEELTRNLIESGFLHENIDEYVLDQPLPSLAIPTTLQDSLLARLDRLAAVKEAAQIGAAIGREFSRELLAAVWPHGPKELDQALARLATAELVQARGAPPHAIYTFKHALVQDAAYSTLLHSRRLVLHARIAEVLCTRFPAIAENQPELVAHHAAAAGDAEAAVRWWLRAGERAVFRSANAEAIAHLKRASKALTTLPAPVRERHELDVAALLGQATMEMRGYADPETRAVWQHARELLTPRSDLSRKFSVYYGLWAAAYVRGEVELQRQVATEAFEEATRIGDRAGLCVANRNLGTTLVIMGELERGRVHLQQARDLYDPERHRPLMYRFGQDIGATALSHLSLVLYHLGLIDQSQAVAREAMRHAEGLAHPHTVAYTGCHTRVFLDACRARCGDPRAYADLVAHCTRHDLRFWGAITQMYHSWASICHDEVGAGMASFEPALQFVRKIGTRNWLPFYLAWYAQGWARLGKLRRGLDTIAEAIAVAEETGEVFGLSDLLRVRAEMLPRDRAAEAWDCLSRGFEIARTQHARCFQLRAAMGLMRLAATSAQRATAASALRAARSSFTEGFADEELVAADACLAELA